MVSTGRHLSQQKSSTSLEEVPGDNLRPKLVKKEDYHQCQQAQETWETDVGNPPHFGSQQLS